MTYTRLARLRTPAEFRAYLSESGIQLDFDERLEHGPDSPLAQPLDRPETGLPRIGNRFCILPMEGWDAGSDGRPSELTIRRWERFGASGAKLIWGGEAVAVSPGARANPNQLVVSQANLPALAALRDHLVSAHAGRWRSDDLLVGLQLTHSGRFCCPNEKGRLEPRILYHHPILDRKFDLPPGTLPLNDGEIEAIITDHVTAAMLAWKAGFDFVDVKHCHGYLGHEFLSAVDRPGRYGGSFENRTRFLREVVDGIRAEAPGLHIGVRLSAFDFIPFRPGPDGTGQPEPFAGSYPYAFGGDGSGTGLDLAEPSRFLSLLESLDIRLVNISAGSPYYNPHIQRPALFPPSDGYLPPEDPLAGVARQLEVTARLKAAHPGLVIVGTGYTYLQEWLPHVAQFNIHHGRTDFVGLGRMALAYPQFCADVLEGRPLQRKRLCRTISDCTTAPRAGLVSGCYPLDEYYKARPEALQLEALK